MRALPDRKRLISELKTGELWAYGLYGENTLLNEQYSPDKR
jgi:hypothetical protein